MDEEEFVTVRVTEVVFLGGSIAQGMGELEGGGIVAFYGESERMAEIAAAIEVGELPEALVPRRMLRLPHGGSSPMRGSAESTGVAGSDPVTGDGRRLP